jgi:hypothetical protein
MGSPSSRLNVRESLRPWLESGLEFVYAPGGLTAEAQLDPVQAQPAGQTSAQTHGNISPARQPVQEEPRQQPNAPQAQQAQRQDPASSNPSVRPSAQPSQNFPAPWSQFLRFTKPEARVVMTYMELGLDLGGQSDPRRRDVLKNLQAHLKWPLGTINFWPMAALVNGALQPDPGMFWRGWELWHTPHIVCFGDEALRVILPDAEQDMLTHFLDTCVVYKVPSIKRLIDMLPHEQQMAVDAIANIRL